MLFLEVLTLLLQLFALSKHLNTKNIHFVFVNNGLLRKYDEANIRKIFKSFKLKLNVIDAQNIFVKKLKNIKEPERKRKIIGSLFIISLITT